jgi:putative drug exporter of the RND superfamily
MFPRVFGGGHGCAFGTMRLMISRTGDQPGNRSASAGPERSRRLRWLLPAALLLGWLALSGIAGPYTGKLSEVQQNDAADFLPDSAESGQAAERARAFTDDTGLPGLLLVESSTALTPGQLVEIRRFAAALPTLSFPVDGNDVLIGELLVAGPVPVVVAEDGRAALILVNFDDVRIGRALPDGSNPVERAVRTIRDATTGLESDGLRVALTGPAGTVADLVDAFAGIDGLLLLVALSVVAVILVLVYRSPVLPVIVLASAAFALGLASLVVYLLAERSILTLDGQAQGILSILVVGAATDYSLLLVARYREELRRYDDRYEAMWLAWRRTLEPVAASAGTVVAGLLCLLLSDLSSTRGLGPVGSIGIVAAMLAALTFLPAVLVLPGWDRPGAHGRWIFWPGIPHRGSAEEDPGGVWGRLARLIGAHPRRVWGVTVAVLVLLAAFLPTFSARGTTQAQTFLTEVESVTGADALPQHFPAGSGDPTVVIGPAEDLPAMTALARDRAGVAQVTPVTDEAGQVRVVNGLVELDLTLTDAADSAVAEATVIELRTVLDQVSPRILVGGSTAAALDARAVSARDRKVVIPVILGVIFLLLALLLRSWVAPMLLLAANVLSFAATLGVSALVFNHVLDLPGADPSVPLYGFVFLIALGIDYSIFLMTRIREESTRIGTRSGVLVGLTVTGRVITSAGIVLAATFASLAVLPLLFLVQIAFIVAFGVLLDTFVVRSLLVPAASYDLGRVIWWPGALWRRDGATSDR